MSAVAVRPSLYINRHLWLAGLLVFVLPFFGCAASRSPNAGDVALMDTRQAAPPAQPGSQAQPYDPFEPINNKVLTFNEKVDDWVLYPAAQGYSQVVPSPARAGVVRFFNNVSVLPRFANDLFQLRFAQAGTEVGVSESIQR
jgi:ABC-type transporter lipoprotein component MlaA